MFLFLSFFLGILSSICFFSVKNEAKDEDNSPWKWESVWNIFMTEYINGFKKKSKKIILLGTTAIALLALAIICFILFTKYN